MTDPSQTDDQDPSPADGILEESETQHGPNRRCIASGVVGPMDGLIRFVIAPDGCMIPDLEAKLPGRGFWLSARRDMVNTATAKGLFRRAARRPVTVWPDLADRLEGLLLRRLQDSVGLARRAGKAVAGFEKVCAGLKEKSGALVLAAYDGAADSRGKIEALARGRDVIALLSRDELGAAFGRDQAVHALIAAGRLADRIRTDSLRLAGFRAHLNVSMGRGSPAKEE